MKAPRKNHGQTFRNAYASTAQNTHKSLTCFPSLSPPKHTLRELLQQQQKKEFHGRSHMYLKKDSPQQLNNPASQRMQEQEKRKEATDNYESRKTD